MNCQIQTVKNRALGIYKIGICVGFGSCSLLSFQASLNNCKGIGSYLEVN